MAMADSSFVNDNVFIQGPSFHVDLAPIDALHPVHYSPRLLIFRCSSSAQRDAQLAALKTGLQALVSRCPIFGGIVVPVPSDITTDGQKDWRTIVPGQGLELVVRDLRTAIASFDELEAAEFPAVQLPHHLLMPVPEDLGDGPFPSCKVQFSAIEGGTIITFTISHSLADGSGTNELMRILSEETKFTQEPSNRGARPTGLGLDRSVLRNITSKLPFKIEDHPAFRWETPPPAKAEPVPPHPFKASSPETTVLLHISAANLVQLKSDATLPGAPPISTHDALSALIWRTVLLIRSRRSSSAQKFPASAMSSIFMPSDARRHLNLPQSYIGNVVYQLTANLDLKTLLSSSGLGHAASALRRAIKAVNSDLVASYMTELKERWIGWQFMNGTLSTTGVAMGTDWTSTSMYSDDWGEAFGPVVRYRYPGAVGEVGNFILPKLPDGSAEVMVGAMPEEVGMLKGMEGFGKYIEV
jgi:hypothetical protein